MPGWTDHWRNFKDYLMRLPRLHGWPPEKQIVALEVWQVTVRVPVPGSLEFTDLQRRKLFDQSL
jgi:hypothetical protein